MAIQIKDFFTNMEATIENKSLWIHADGYNKKIKDGIDYNLNKILSGDYEGSPFEEVVIKTLPDSIPRLD